MKFAILVFTDETCIIDSQPYKGLPLLLDSNLNIVEHVSSFLRSLATEASSSSGYIMNVGNHFKLFARWLDNENILWEDVTGKTFIKWRNEEKYRISKAKGYLSDDEQDRCKRFIDGKLKQFYKFYWWAQNKGYFTEIIGSGFKKNRAKYPIPIRLPSSKNHSSAEIICPILYNKKYDPAIKLPTDKEIDKLHDTIVDERRNRKSKFAEELLVRDGLIVDWGSILGLRRNEIACLRVSDLPKMEEVEKAENIDHKTMCAVYLKHGTKNKKPRRIIAPPHQIRSTWDYVNFQRNTLLKGRVHKGEPPEVFISSRHAALNPQSVYAIIRDFSKKKIRTHDLRHKALTEFAYREMDAAASSGEGIIDHKGIAVAVMEQAGHKSFEFTMSKYVHPAQRKKELEKGFAENIHAKAGCLQAAKKVNQQQAREIKELKAKLEIAEKFLDKQKP